MGQDFSGADRVVVLIEKDGMRHAWEILEPGVIRWDFAGLGPSGTEAELRVGGVFHRLTRMAGFYEVEPSSPELGAGDE